jgi:fluoride ion exporter CrcB/FEX
MPLWIWVTFGSGLGGVARYAVAKTWPSVPGRCPIATISVNVVGGSAWAPRGWVACWRPRDLMLDF